MADTDIKALLKDAHLEDPYYRDLFMRLWIRQVYKDNVENVVQMVHTPLRLCKEIVNKLKQFTTLQDKKVLVLNVEFLPYVKDAKEVYLFADNNEKVAFARALFPKVKIVSGIRFLEWEPKMKFDVIVGNPPYQMDVKQPENKPKQGFASGGHTVWEQFVPPSFDICKEKGYVCLVHPARWRKPEDSTGKFLKSKNMRFLRIFNKKQGEMLFGAITRADYYVCENAPQNGECKIVDENGNNTIVNFSDWAFVPNFDFPLLLKILANNTQEKCGIIYDSSAYHTTKTWMSPDKNAKFKYPCVNSTGVKEVRNVWSSTNENGLFGIPKIIFGSADVIGTAVVDFEGDYAMTEQAMAIPISSKDEGNKIKKALETKKFNDFLKACRWSNFRIDYKMFKYFRKDFWREFV